MTLPFQEMQVGEIKIIEKMYQTYHILVLKYRDQEISSNYQGFTICKVQWL